MPISYLTQFEKRNFITEQFPQTIVIFRALMLGDLLCTVPAFRALRRAFPQSKITLVGLPWAAGFAERFSHYFDEFIEFPGYPGLPEHVPDIQKVPLFLKKVQSRHFDLALQMHGSGSFVNPLIALFGAKLTAGFYEENDYCPSHEWFMPFPRDHEIFTYLRLIEFLGIPLQGVHLEFPLSAKEEKELEESPETSAVLKNDYICVHAGARLATRRWFPERFAEAANDLGEMGLTIVLTGSAAETDLVEEVSRRLRYPHLNLAGKTGLGALGALISRAKLLISNDTGVSHIAAALKTPSVIIVTGSDPKRWAPLDKDLHRTCLYDVGCRPCGYNRCPFGLICAHGVDTEDVVLQAKALLKKKIKKPIAFP